MDLVRGILVSFALIGTVAACKEPEEAKVAEPSFCVETDEQCHEKFGYAVGQDGEVRYGPNANGLPYRGLFRAVKTRSFKDEFETTEAQKERVSATPAFVKKQFGEKFALRRPLARLSYDADNGLMRVEEGREDVHDLELHQVRASYEHFSIVSQPCPNLLSFPIPPSEAQAIDAKLDADEAEVFYVGDYNSDFSRQISGFETIAAGFLEESYPMENPIYGYGTYSNRWIALELERLDIVEKATGKILFSASCDEPSASTSEV